MINLKNLSFAVFDKELNQNRHILKNVNLQFPKNKVTVITGHNGSGKSTLIKLIMGLEKPTEGKVLLGTKDITDLTVFERANLGITIAFQQPVMFKGLIVKDLLKTACKNKKVDVSKFLKQVGLNANDYLEREVNSTLSGGELKRIEIAMALAKDGKVFLFDEPEAGIDLWSFESLISVFQGLKEKTIIIVSHQKKILEMADYILLINGNDDLKMDEKSQMLLTLLNNKESEEAGFNGQA